MRIKIDVIPGTACKVPERAHAGDLGFDIHSIDGETICPPGEVTLVKTGLHVEFPEGVGAFIKDRSSMATKRKLFVVGGVIDNGYRGEILVALYNGGREPQVIKWQEKIAQLVPISVLDVGTIEVVSDFDTSSTSRGTAGFGSTGK